MSGPELDVVREVAVPNREGLHARPVMAFVDLASRFGSTVVVQNATRQGEKVDGKSAMQMMLLEATQGCVLSIEAHGTDADETVEALVALVETGFQVESRPEPKQPDTSD